VSWSVWNVPIPARGEPTRDTRALVQEAIDRTAEDSPTYRHAFDAQEVQNQLAAASAALDELIGRGAVGTGPWTANLSGHANPGHARRSGYAADSITVTLVNATPIGDPAAAAVPGR
jgi:hypothetical protein